jgi:NADH-quinone oxidoreductase subunit G
MDTVTLTIDGQPITVRKGRTVLEAAIEQGLKIPYYCFHPGLGVDGSCRVCIVKVEKLPKLQTACSTVCADGMVVHTATPEVVAARASVFEFLLLNHPLDCPVCDKGGECPLQDFSYAFGPAASRMEFARRVFDGEGVKADVDFGPTLMLNRNRCILCTRCVRFMREIDTDPQISIIDRGYGSGIATFQEQGVHSLLSGNLMDVCPVGAITTKDYRFKSRPWDNPDVADTICTACAKGCSISVWLKAKPEWARGSRLVRITPRYNPEVNGYWMCDLGRFGYHWVESDARLRRPAIRTDAELEDTTWRDALVRAAGIMRDAGPGAVAFLVSAHASLEELHLIDGIARAFSSRGAADTVTVSWKVSPKTQPAHTRFPIPAVDAPNVTGARDLGLVTAGDTPDLSGLRAAVEAGRVRVLYVLDPGPEGTIGDIGWIVDARQSGSLPLLIVQGALRTPLVAVADVVLPGVTWVEKDASYVNDQGRLQAAPRALAPPGDAREDWLVLTGLATALGLPVTFAGTAEVRASIARALAGCPGYDALPRLEFTRAIPARHWLQASNPSERWKWDFLFQDRPPVKGDLVTSSVPRVIPLHPTE